MFLLIYKYVKLLSNVREFLLCYSKQNWTNLYTIMIMAFDQHPYAYRLYSSSIALYWRVRERYATMHRTQLFAWHWACWEASWLIMRTFKHNFNGDHKNYTTPLYKLPINMIFLTASNKSLQPQNTLKAGGQTNLHAYINIYVLLCGTVWPQRNLSTFVCCIQGTRCFVFNMLHILHEWAILYIVGHSLHL